MTLLDNIHVVLVRPQNPANIGSAARAMKNMGLSHLTLVAPPSYDPEIARWRAPGCADLLARVRLVATLDEALEGTHRAVATTARHRKQGHPVFTPRDIAQTALADGRVTALLFGQEDSGLDREAVERCEAICRIPTPEHASLNLAAAVLLVSHTLFEVARSQGEVATGRTLGGSRTSRSTEAASRPSDRDGLADLRQLEPAAAALTALLSRVGYTRSAAERKILLTARQALQRAHLSVRHVEAMRGMTRRVAWALDNPGVDWKASRAAKKQGGTEP